MVRVKRGNVARSRRKRVLQNTKSASRNRNRFRYAIARHDKQCFYSTRDRRVKKRMIRRLWITRINGWSRSVLSISYSQLINALKKNKIIANRKVLATSACKDQSAMNAFIAQVPTLRVPD